MQKYLKELWAFRPSRASAGNRDPERCMAGTEVRVTPSIDRVIQHMARKSVTSARCMATSSRLGRVRLHIRTDAFGSHHSPFGL